MNYTITPVKKIQGRASIPGDKSISHRALILGALAQGTTEVDGLLNSADVQSTQNCLRDLGVTIRQKNQLTYIEGHAHNNFNSPRGSLDCGNSGSTMRMLMGVLAGQENVTATLVGDQSLSQRPMQRVALPLKKMGAQIELSQQNFAPLTIKGQALHAIEYSLPVASAQLKSALLLATLKAEGVTKLSGAIASRNHSELLLPHFGAKLIVNADSITMAGRQSLVANRVVVPGDPSTAAFFIAAATLVPGSNLELVNIGLNPTRIGFLQAIQKMGAAIKISVEHSHPELVGSLQVKAAGLKAITIHPHEVASLIDELPLLAIVATQAHGTTVVRGASELRHKESDRIASVAANLQKMGCTFTTYHDGFSITGPQPLKGAVLASYHDHRIAMAFSVAGLIAEGSTTIEDAECVGVSFAEFYQELKGITV